MSSYAQSQIPSPSASDLNFKRRSSTTDSTESSSARNMLKINSLLNPSTSESTPPTPASTVISSCSSITRADTPATVSPNKRQKLVKDAAVFKREEAKVERNHSPFECTENAICLHSADRQELADQHKLFEIYPSGNAKDGLIADYTRHIPYSSEKKGFRDITGKQGFDVYQYTFRLPNDPSRREYVVMWDYANGLVRITPFFKACHHSKTTPAKALNANPGLKDLSYSITGGALAAQGYWIPYHCARALCTTFCYSIRWALTPIFGPSFINECIKPGNQGYEKWKIDGEAIRNAQLEAEGWSMVQKGGQVGQKTIPRSVPPDAVTAVKELRPRSTNTTFKAGSPFESEAETDYAATPVTSSPELSPKSSYGSPGWTSINRPHPKLPPPTSGGLSESLLAQPRCVSWRPEESTSAGYTSKPRQLNAAENARERDRTHKRRRSTLKRDDPDADYVENRQRRSHSTSASESDDIDVVISPPLTKKRTCRQPKLGVSNTSPSSPSPAMRDENKSQKYTADDFRAAAWLLSLSQHDSDLATGPNGPVKVTRSPSRGEGHRREN